MPDLSPVSHAVLGAVARRPTHGFAVAKLFTPDGELGRVWSHPRSLVYREIDRLIGLGLVEERRREPGRGGPHRTVIAVTRTGRRVHARWLTEPVDRVRDFRSAFLLKLALLELAGLPSGDLVAAQRQRFDERLAELRAERAGVEGFDVTLVDWRTESTRAAIRFLDRLSRARVDTRAD